MITPQCVQEKQIKLPKKTNDLNEMTKKQHEIIDSSYRRYKRRK